ncbi:MAG: sulfatase-like hydrolase/transferase [Candidatus Latescibacteria bacterium]|nr:sulfatase-like hydrolase/transferase [Candidatus Latescibacterota bacterium]
MKTPNIVFFMVDQLSAKWVEAAESGVCELPNLQRLKKRGVNFTRAITSNPVCCATRATLATGMSTRGHGVLENGYQLNPDLPTFMQVLQGCGWRTGAFGKVHFQPHFRGLWPDYKPYGFDETHITEDARGGEWLDWVEENHPDHYESVLATIWPTKIPEFAQYGADKRDLRARIEKIRETFQWATEEHPRNTFGASTLPFPQEVCQTNWITGHALDFIHGMDADQPFFAQISYVQPHGPFHVPAEYLSRVDTSKIPEPLDAEWVQDPHAPKELSRREPIAGDWEYARHCYFADLCHLDEQLGKIMTALEETGRLDDTYIIFLSDHGDMCYDHGFLSKEEKHYDACIRVPLVIAGPGVSPAATCEAMVQLEDICPTILDAASQRMPLLPKMGPYLDVAADQIPALPGRSLLPLCTAGIPDDWRKAAYSESYNHINSAHHGQWARTVRTEQYRYTYYPDGHGEQLFDLLKDPDEQNNLVADPTYAETRIHLRDRLLDLVIQQDYPKTRRDLFAFGVH